MTSEKLILNTVAMQRFKFMVDNLKEASEQLEKAKKEIDFWKNRCLYLLKEKEPNKPEVLSKGAVVEIDGEVHFRYEK